MHTYICGCFIDNLLIEIYPLILPFFLKVDKDSNGGISLKSFTGICKEKFMNRDNISDMQKAFRLFDGVDGTGRITFKKLRKIAKELGESLTDEELQEMIDEADRNGDGEIDEEVWIQKWQTGRRKRYWIHQFISFCFFLKKNLFLLGIYTYNEKNSTLLKQIILTLV